MKSEKPLLPKCPRCEQLIPVGEALFVCPRCDELVCTARCIAGRNVACFQCEESGGEG